MPRVIKTRLPVLIFGLFLAAPRAAFACSACVGRSDDAVTKGLNAAVLTLMAALLLVMGPLVGLLVCVIRHSVKHPLARPGVPAGVVR
jgi:hypothetical protein